MHPETLILRVAIATPLRRLFDYLHDQQDSLNIKPGCRVAVPFGKRKETVGIVVSIESKSEYPLDKLKSIKYVIDREPLFNQAHLDFLLWSSRYYHHPVGEVLFNTIPGVLRKSQPLEKQIGSHWQLTETGKTYDPNKIKNSSRQAQLLNYFQTRNEIIAETELQ